MSNSTATSTVLLGFLVALAAVAVLIGAAMATRRQARARSVDLQRRRHLDLAELSDVERERFAHQWTRIQRQFVDDPIAAVAGAHRLADDVMQARGYPVEAIDRYVDDRSVDLGSVAGLTRHYRAARSLSASVASDQANTEDLRRAEVHYRKLFAHLLEQPRPPSRRRREAHA
jgi:hypothetical protein